MRMLFGMLVVLVVPASLSALHHVKASDFGGVRFVKMSDFAPPKPATACPCECPCGDGGICDCGPNCKCDFCPGLTAYESHRRKAIREKRGLFVWVGMAANPSVAPDALHVSVPLGWQGYTKPQRIESYYEDGNLWQGRRQVMSRPAVRMATRSC